MNRVIDMSVCSETSWRGHKSSPLISPEPLNSGAGKDLSSKFCALPHLRVGVTEAVRSSWTEVWSNGSALELHSRSY